MTAGHADAAADQVPVLGDHQGHPQLGDPQELPQLGGVQGVAVLGDPQEDLQPGPADQAKRLRIQKLVELILVLLYC